MNEQAKRDRRMMLEANAKSLGLKTVPCSTCGDPTTHTGTGKCDGCWEVEHRLRGYIINGGEKARSKLAEALYAGGEVRELSNSERHRWGTCPVCGAGHGQTCFNGTGKSALGAHVRRLEKAPLKVREVGVP